MRALKTISVILPMALGLVIIAPEAFAMGGGGGGGGSAPATSQPEPKITKFSELPQGVTKDREGKPVDGSLPTSKPDTPPDEQGDPVRPGNDGKPDIDGENLKNGNLPQGKTREDIFDPPASKPDNIDKQPKHESFGYWNTITTGDGITTRFGYDLHNDGSWGYEENHFDLSEGRSELIAGTYEGKVIGKLRNQDRITTGDVAISLKNLDNNFILNFTFNVEGKVFGFENIRVLVYDFDESIREHGRIRGDIIGKDNDGIVGEFQRNGIMRGSFGAIRE